MNQLANAPSPYLKQHAHQPVQWQPYGEEAFLQAQVEDKPVFLSIGYATCHWCHVMAQESFNDPEVARLLNTYFVPVKVDRETHPEVDRFYMDACQMITGQGGWPLSVFTDYTGRPFYAATYLPKKSRFNQVGMLDLLPQIHRLWLEQRDRLQEAGAEIIKIMASAPKGASILDLEHLETVATDLLHEVDQANGGFGGAPKFPVPQRLRFLLQLAVSHNDAKAQKALTQTLDAMAKGGLYDHVGGGFFRYATDAEWRLPHFEKMLDDNALLAKIYLEAAHHLQAPRFLAVAEATLQFLLREMKSPEGLYYAALDADTEGQEGAYYLWREAELETVLTPDTLAKMQASFGLEEPVLYDGYHLHQTQAGAYQVPVDEVEEGLGRLFNARLERTSPFVDEKMLLGRNALMLSLWATKARLNADREALQTAEDLANTIEAVFHQGDYYALSYYDGKPFAVATLSDLSALLLAYLDLYDASLKATYLFKAVALVKHINEAYRDEAGGYFETHVRDTALPLRQKRLFDGADQSGASRLLEGLLRLEALLATADLRQDLDAYVTFLEQQPQFNQIAYLGFWLGLSRFLLPNRTYLCSDAQGRLQKEAFQLAREKGVAFTSILYVNSENHQALQALTPLLAEIPATETAVRRCENGVCQLPQKNFGDAYA